MGVTTLNVSAQCTTIFDPDAPQWPAGAYSPACSGTAEVISDLCFTGEYSVVNVTNGTMYTFSSDIATDYLTITNATATTNYAFGVSPVTWTASFTGTIRFWTHANAACGFDGTNFRDRRVQCGTPPPPGQCLNSDAFGTAAVDPNGAIVTITTVQFAGEYATINNVVNGTSLRFTSSVSTDYFTVRSGTPGGPVVGFGVTPLTITATSSGTYYLHVNTSSDCGTEDLSRTTTVQCTSCTAPPTSGNDACAGAITVTCGSTTTGTTVGATIDAVGTCTTALGTAPGVWYKITGNGQLVTASLCGSGYDTKIGVFSGSCGALVCVVGNDDFCGLQSQVTFPSVVGTTYNILVTGFSTNAGSFTLNVTCANPPTAPVNDNCASATPVTVNPALVCTSVTPGTLAGATGSTGPTSTCGNYDDDVWFSFVATSATHQVELLNITGGTTDLTHQVLTGCGATTALVCSDPNLSTVGGLTIGTTYYIRVASWTATIGQTSNFNVCVKTPPPPPANDLCVNAIEFPCNGSVTGTTLFSTSDAAPTCDGFPNTSIGVWYTFTGTGFPVTISSCGGVTWDNKISVYTGSCGALTCVAADDDDCNPGLQALVDFASTAGTTYYILVHGFGTAAGDFTLTLTTAQCNACKGTDPPRVSSLTGTSATINWNSVVGTTGYGYTVGTGLLLCPSNSTVVNTTSTSANLTGLLPGTDYTVCVRANTCSGGTSPSAWSSVRFTTPGNCEAPSQPFVSGLTSTSATLTWPAVAGVTSYKWSRGSSSTCANGTLTTTGSNTVTITGLIPGTTYYFCVQSDCGSSASGFVSARFTTLATPGSRPAGTNVGDLIDYSVYPNPANEDINLALNNFPAGKNVNVQIINQLGQTMVTHRFTNENNHVETIRVDQLPDGIYIMSVQSEGTEQKFKKFVKGALRP